MSIIVKYRQSLNKCMCVYVMEHSIKKKLQENVKFVKLTKINKNKASQNINKIIKLY